MSSQVNFQRVSEMAGEVGIQYDLENFLTSVYATDQQWCAAIFVLRIWVYS